MAAFAVAFCALGLAVVLTPRSAVSGADGVKPEDEPGIPALIDQLGAAPWSEREEASKRLIESGSAAVPFLRAALQNTDPEISQRLRWILSILAPESHQVRVLRYANWDEETFQARPESAPRLVEWADIATREDKLGSASTTNLEGGSSQVFAGVVPGSWPPRVWLRFGEGEPDVLDIGKGEIALLHEEERVEIDTYEGRVSRRRLPSMWLVWLDPKDDVLPPSGANDEGTDEYRSRVDSLLRQQIAAQLRSNDSHTVQEALRVTGFRRDAELLVEPLDAQRIPWLLARLECRDQTAIPALEEWLFVQSDDFSGDDADPATEVDSGNTPTNTDDDDSDNSDETSVPGLDGALDSPVVDELAGDVAIELTRQGSEVGFDYLLPRVLHMKSWQQYQGMTALTKLLEGYVADDSAEPREEERGSAEDTEHTTDDSEGTADSDPENHETAATDSDNSDGSGSSSANAATPKATLLQRLLAYLGNSGMLDEMPWRFAETEYLLQLLEAAEPRGFHARLVELLDRGLTGADTSRGGGKTRSLLRALRRSQERGTIQVDTWFDSLVLPMITGVYTEEGVCLARDALLAGQLSDEQWSAVVEKIEAVYRSEDNGMQYRLDPVIKQLVYCAQLTPSQARELWFARMGCFETQSFMRQQVDRDLVQAFGALDSRAPAAGKSAPIEPWQERREEWEDKLDALGDDLRPNAGTKARLFNLVEVDFRVDLDNDDIRPMRFESAQVREDESYPATGPEGEDRTRRIEPFQRNPRPGQKLYFSVRTGQRVELNIPQVVPQRQRSTFREVLVREGAWSPTTTGRRRQISYRTLYWLADAFNDDGDEVTLPSDWPEFEQEIITGALEGSDPKPYRKIISELRLTGALERLRKKFDRRQAPGIARVLLKLGDPVGIPVMRNSINPDRDPSQAVQTLKLLVGARDEWAVDKTLEWLRDPPPRVAGQRYTLLDAIDQALTAMKDPLIIETDELLETLVACLSHQNLVSKTAPMLRRLTGHNFGYQETFQIRDHEKRRKEQAEVLRKWHDWWDEHKKSSAAPSRPESGQSDEGTPNASDSTDF